MGTQAHWFSGPLYYVPVDEDGEDSLGRRYVDTITEAKAEAADAGYEAIRVYRRGRWGDRRLGTYALRGSRLVKI